MIRRPNDPAPTWQGMAITIAAVAGLLAGVAAVVFSAALLQRTCAFYDLTGEEARCQGRMPPR